MATTYNEVPPPTPDADTVYVFCVAEVRAQRRTRPVLSSVSTDDLFSCVTVSLAHAVETATRSFGASDPPNPDSLARSVGSLLMTPTSTGLYALWRAWGGQHPDLPLAVTLQVPVYFLLCQTNAFACLRELARRARINRPVFKAWAGLNAGPDEPDVIRRQRFLRAMDRTLQVTVRRRLEITRDAGHEDDLSTTSDAESVAVMGALEREHRARAWIVELLRRGGKITTDRGELIEIPTIPEVPVYVMERASGYLQSVWRDAAKDVAIKIFARLAPGTFGILETVLPDAAHAAQRAERDSADAKKRGGTGGRKARQTGKAQRPVQHLSIGVPTGDPEKDLNCIDPDRLVDDRLNPEQEVEAHEQQAKLQADAESAMRIAIARWGSSGLRMLEALQKNLSYKEAAKAAGITAPALTKRLKTLQKQLKDADPPRPLT